MLRQIRDLWLKSVLILRQIRDWWFQNKGTRITVTTTILAFIMGMVPVFIPREYTAGLPGIEDEWLLLVRATIPAAMFLWRVLQHRYQAAVFIFQVQILATLLGWATGWGLLIIADEIGIGAISYIF